MTRDEIKQLATLMRYGSVDEKIAAREYVSRLTSMHKDAVYEEESLLKIHDEHIGKNNC